MTGRSLMLLLMVAGCATGTRTARVCPPLPTEYQAYEGLYQQCNVDQRARVTSTPRPDFSRLEPLLNSRAGCYSADFTLVVDENGVPVDRSIKLVRTTSQSYARAIEEMVRGLRFDPAKKDGMPVRQFYEYEAKMQYRSMSGTGSRPPPC